MADELAPQDEEATIDDTLAANWERIQSERTIDDAPIEKAHETPAETESEKAERLRDEQGRFTAKTEDEKSAEVPTIDVQPSELKRDMPVSWRREVGPEWDKLSDRVKDEVLKREADVRRGFENYKADAEVGKSFKASIQPYMATIQSMGATPEQASQALFNADHQLRYGNPQQKMEMLGEIVRSYNIDVSALMPQIDQSQGEQAQQASHPEVTELRQRLERYEQQQTYNAQLSQQQQQAQLEHQTAMAIADFAYEREPNGSLRVRGYDDLGNPVYQPKTGREDFGRVSMLMGALMQADPSKSLEQAYQDALYAHPETRQTLIAQQQEQHREDAKQKAEAARKAGAVNIRARGALPSVAKAGSMDETIAAKAIELGLAS